jgi:CMP-N-acetylneuraminic acid synthetase
MKKIEDVCVVVQARLGSQRVPGKMLRPFAGSTLTDILLDKLKFSQVIPKKNIFFSAYEQELKDVAHKHGIQIYNRSEKSANSEGNPLSEIYEWHDKLPFKYVVLISACNPLLKLQTINNFFQKYLTSDNDGQFAVFEKKQYYWSEEEKPITDWQGSPIMNTKFIKPIYEAAHCLYASRLDVIKDGCWMGDTSPPEPKLFVMDELEAFDIDHEWQFKIGEQLYGNL